MQALQWERISVSKDLRLELKTIFFKDNRQNDKRLTKGKKLWTYQTSKHITVFFQFYLERLTMGIELAIPLKKNTMSFEGTLFWRFPVARFSLRVACLIRLVWNDVVSFSFIRLVGSSAVLLCCIRPFANSAVSLSVLWLWGSAADFENHIIQRGPNPKPCKFWPLEKNPKCTVDFEFHCTNPVLFWGGEMIQSGYISFSNPLPPTLTCKK